MSTKYRFLEDTDHVQRVFTVNDHYGSVEGTFYTDLGNILSQEYPDAELDFMYDMNAHAKYVIEFATEEDCLMFSIKYGHIYGL